MILYHGGAEEIVAPDLLHSRKAVDFGAGFYVTPIFEQAKRWSEKRKRRMGTAVVSHYEFDESAVVNLKVHGGCRGEIKTGRPWISKPERLLGQGG